MALYSNTLASIRQFLSSAVGDLIYGTADSGTANTLVHSMLIKPNDYYNDHKYRGYIYSGPSIGEEREVTDSVLANTELTFTPVFTNAITNNSSYELHHIFYSDEYLKAINLAIENMADKYFVDIKDESTITLSADTYEYALPTSMLYLYRVITEKEAGGGIFRESDIIDPRAYSIIRSYPPKLKLCEGFYKITAGKDLRLEGQGAQPTVDDDTDIIYLPTDWLIAEAILNLPQSKIQSNKLSGVYQQAREDVNFYRRTARNYPDPRAQRVVE